MSADTGVGPSIASGSHACSGNWPDFPQAPSSRSRPSAVVVAAPSWPTPPNTSVISSTNTADSGSKSSPTSIFRPPTGRYWNRSTEIARSPERPRSAKNSTRPMTNDAPTLAQPSRWPQRSARRPRTSRIPALTSGIAISSHRATGYPLILQQVRVVDAGRAPSPEDRHDDGEADDDLGRRHDHHEEGHDLAVQGPVDAAERDEREVRRVQHQLDAHEQDDRVAPDEHADRADGEQRPGQ